MTDPLDVLRATGPASAPSPAPDFVARLRARLERAVQLPIGVPVNDFSLEPRDQSQPVQAQGRPVTGEGRPRHGDIGYLSIWVPDVRRAAAFYAAVLGWDVRPGTSEQSRHVEMEGISHGLAGGAERAGAFLCFAVDDVDRAVQVVRHAGGTAREPETRPYGRLADCVDDQGQGFALYTPPGGTARVAAPTGALRYVTMEVVDADRARSFYGAVLGWHFRPGSVPEGWEVEGADPPVGIWGGREEAATVPVYAVGNLAMTLERVQAAGGIAGEAERHRYGALAPCTDDQGTRFVVSEA